MKCSLTALLLFAALTNCQKSSGSDMGLEMALLSYSGFFNGCNALVTPTSTPQPLSFVPVIHSTGSFQSSNVFLSNIQPGRSVQFTSTTSNLNGNSSPVSFNTYRTSSPCADPFYLPTDNQPTNDTISANSVTITIFDFGNLLINPLTRSPSTPAPTDLKVALSPSNPCASAVVANASVQSINMFAEFNVAIGFMVVQNVLSTNTIAITSTTTDLNLYRYFAYSGITACSPTSIIYGNFSLSGSSTYINLYPAYNGSYTILIQSNQANGIAPADLKVQIQ